MSKREPLYFAGLDHEYCYPLQYHRDMIEGTDQTITLHKAIPVPTTHVFWCREAGEGFEAGSCGKDCAAYEPRNGKNGRCRWHSHTFDASETETTTITDKR